MRQSRPGPHRSSVAVRASAAADRLAAKPTLKRCAIYTRKSSEEGLEQAFNSLDAQREACEAYILSQKHVGWTALPTMYDDGGISGGTLERPALQRLLADIAARRIDTVVVYKVDRLTRSLADFAKIVDVFDGSGVAFVSVTQQFNTTSSMGRLTLNMLLSFAQFEREVTGERIRDKIALSKQKGIWMGGRTPLGYDVADRKLVVNDAEAETVRHIYRRYAVLQSVRELSEELRRDGIGGKVRAGQPRGDRSLGRGALYHLLQNRLYRGEITHKGEVYPGQHKAIVEPALWDEVQSTLDDNRVERDNGDGATQPSLLAGLAYDGAGGRLSPTHASKRGRRYRYYVSQSLIRPSHPDNRAGACRVPAADLEAAVERGLVDLLQDQAAMDDLGRAAFGDAATRHGLISAAGDLARRLPVMHPSEKLAILKRLIVRITVHLHAVELLVSGAALAGLGQHDGAPIASTVEDITRTIPTALRRSGMQTKLLIAGTDVDASRTREPDRSLLRLLARAHQFRNALMDHQGKSMRDLAAAAGVGPSYFARVLRLAFLAPDLTDAILHGRQPDALTANKLQHLRLPNAWDEQRSQFR